MSRERELRLRVPAHLVLREVADLVLRQPDRDGVGIDAGDEVDRDRDLAPAPEVAPLQHEVRDVVAVDEEAVDLAEVMAVGAGDAARASDLDLALRDAVVDDADLLLVSAGETSPEAAVVVRQGEDLLDPDVPLGVADGRLADAQVREVLDVRELPHLLRAAPKRDLTPVVARDGLLDRDEMEPLVGAVVRLDHEMRHALLDRVDDHVGELSDHLAVAGPNGISELEAHRGMVRATRPRYIVPRG